jgi:hypothetical protein
VSIMHEDKNSELRLSRNTKIFPAGWALRNFSYVEFMDFIQITRPNFLEISKDFLRDDVSIKKLAIDLNEMQKYAEIVISYAGTTDLVECSMMTWSTYMEYLQIQVAQAKFLGCKIFRCFLGLIKTDIKQDEIIRRLNEFCSNASPLLVAIEIHGGVECDLKFLKRILNETPVRVVVDFENMYNANLETKVILRNVSLSKIAYFHQRNLPQIWTEHSESENDEMLWYKLMPEGVFLWEPKKIDDPRFVKKFFHEYKALN